MTDALGRTQPSLIRDVGRRIGLLTPAERLRWLTFFPLAAIAAALETIGGLVVFGLIAALSDPAAMGQQPVMATVAGWLARAGLSPTALTLTVLAAAVYLVKNGVLLAAIYYRARVAGEIAARLAARVVRAYLTAPYVFHQRRNSADIVQNVLTGIPSVFRLFDSMVTLVTEVLVVGGLLALLLRVAAVETLSALAVIGGALGAFVRLTRGRHRRLGERHFELSTRVLQRTQQAIGAIKEVKVFGREQYFYDALARAEGARARVGVDYMALENVPRLLAETAFVLGLLGVVSTLELRGAAIGTVLPLIGLYAYAGFRMIPAAHRLNLHLGLIRYDVAVSTTLCRDMESLESSGPARARAAQPGDRRFQDHLRLERVSYAYDRAAPPILRGLDLEVRRGECVAIVGATGAGKTTLIDLVLGLLEPASGRITVDGRSIADDLRGWQQQIGYVPQDPYLVDDTLRRNVAFGLPDSEIDETAIRSALRIAQLESFADALPDGLDTVLGDRGIRLSGGERQRVSIARALYHDPDVLVFDEATSALDPGTEKDLTRAIEDLRGRKTLIVIAHRLSTVERADRLVLLRDGRVEATGRYAELVRSSAVFREMAALAESPVDARGSAGTAQAEPAGALDVRYGA